jgi:hypothetical protein
LGFLRFTKGGHASTDANHVFAKLAHERFCRPRPTAVSGPLDVLRQAFVDRTLEVSLHAANKVAAGAAFAKITPDKPAGADAKARKATADRRKTVATAAALARATPLSKTDRPGTATAQEMMVWPAAPISAPRHLPSCDIACVEDNGSGSASARAAKS